MATGHAVVYYARAAEVYSAGIKCRYCTLQEMPYKVVLYFTFMFKNMSYSH